jgi:copper chaperone CopZ
VRGALEKVSGVDEVEVTPGNKDVTVHYDAGKVKVDDLLAALKAAGEGASVK